MSEQLDRIEKNVDSIIQVLGGDKALGQKGLLEDYREVKGIAYKNKEDIGRFKWIVTGITTGVSAFIAWLTSLWNS